MNKCFMMQPFDGGMYDKRYESIFAPAIKDAGLEPYRVDQDPGVSIPIDEIESGIRNSELCLAEITTDNPNVWFELGFAIAVLKDVVLVCSDDRAEKFPFDVQHRSIIRYKAESPQDFRELQVRITARITAILKKQAEIGAVSGLSPLKDNEGLSQHEMVALVSVMQNKFIAEGGVSGGVIRGDMNNAGFTDIAVSLALKTLQEKDMIWKNSATDENGYDYSTYTVGPKGERWLVTHQDKLVLRHDSMNRSGDALAKDADNPPF